MNQTSLCSNCGFEVSDDSVSCPNCGTTFDVPVTCLMCGLVNRKEATFCDKCGSRLTPLPYKETHIESEIKVPLWVNVFAVTALLVIILSLSYVIIDNYYSCEIEVDIHSTHITETVDFFLFIDGEKVGEKTVKPGQSWTYHIEYRWSLFDGDTKEITIKAVSQGGGLGNQSDNKHIIISNDGKYNAGNLYI